MDMVGEERNGVDCARRNREIGGTTQAVERTDLQTDRWTDRRPHRRSNGQTVRQTDFFNTSERSKLFFLLGFHQVELIT